MPRDKRISATRPVFPSYLLPTFRFAFRRRSSASSVSSSSSYASEPATSSLATTPSNSPPAHAPISKAPPPPTARRLSRSAPDTLRCMSCSTDVALASQIISKGFTGRYGRAFLVAPPLPPAEQTLANIRVGRSEDRQLVTGWHVVADICCATCSRKLGWKYVDAKEQAQQYKVGKYILEVERVMTHRSWEDFAGEDMGMIEEEGADGSGSGRQSHEVVFDSEDEDECEDIFAGVWDAETVAKRRSQSIARHASTADGL